jgi:hypothetical protein
MRNQIQIFFNAHQNPNISVQNLEKISGLSSLLNEQNEQRQSGLFF